MGNCSFAFRLHGHRRKSLRQIGVKTVICMLYNVIWFSNIPPTRTDRVYDNSLFHSRRQRCHVMYFKITCVTTSFLLQGLDFACVLILFNKSAPTYFPVRFVLRLWWVARVFLHISFLFSINRVFNRILMFRCACDVKSPLQSL